MVRHAAAAASMQSATGGWSQEATRTYFRHCTLQMLGSTHACALATGEEHGGAFSNRITALTRAAGKALWRAPLGWYRLASGGYHCCCCCDPAEHRHVDLCQHKIALFLAGLLPVDLTSVSHVPIDLSWVSAAVIGSLRLATSSAMARQRGRAAPSPQRCRSACWRTLKAAAGCSLPGPSCASWGSGLPRFPPSTPLEPHPTGQHAHFRSCQSRETPGDAGRAQLCQPARPRPRGKCPSGAGWPARAWTPRSRGGWPPGSPTCTAGTPARVRGVSKTSGTWVGTLSKSSVWGGWRADAAGRTAAAGGPTSGGLQQKGRKGSSTSGPHMAGGGGSGSVSRMLVPSA